MAKTCPECDGELVRSATKKKGMEVLKHKDPAAAKAAGCGMGFITVRTKGAASNGKEETGTPAQSQTPKVDDTQDGYRAAVKRTAKRGKSGGRSNRQSAQHVPQQQSNAPAPKPAGGGGGFARGFFSDVTDTLFPKRK